MSARSSRLVALLVVVLAIAAGVFWLRQRVAALPVLATLPEFVLENEQRASTSLFDLHGTVWVAGFTSPKCSGPCEQAGREMVALAKEIGATPSLAQARVVAFSVLPEADRPDLLREHARINGLDTSHWTFLTGTRNAMRATLRDGFGLSPAQQDDPGTPLVQSQQLFLVDREGRTRGSFDETEDGRERLRAGLAKLMAEPRPQDVYVPADGIRPPWLKDRSQAQIASAAQITVPHDFRFTDRIGASGITFKHGYSLDVGFNYTANHYDHGTAVAAADVDADGRLDLYFVNQVGKSRLFRNAGEGRFEDVTDQSGAGVDGRSCVGAAFADIDNDGDSDLFVSCVREGNVLFQNDGHGKFANITDSARVGGTGTHASGSVFFDYDGDGLLDLFVTSVGRYTRDLKRPNGLWAALLDAFAGHLHPNRYEQSILYHNLGNGRFENASMASGLIHSAWSGEATPFDYDADGRPDLVVLSMQGHDELWRNAGGGRFESTGRQVLPSTPWGSMGVKVLDWNGDGRFDLYITDMHTDMSSPLMPENEARKQAPKLMFPANFLNTDGKHVLGNALFTNEGKGVLKEESDAANAETGWPWGMSAGDLNADGWPDLFVAGGMNYPFRYRGNDVLLNEGGKRFAPAEYALGVEPRSRLMRPWFTLDCDKDVEQDICTGEVAPLLADDTRSPEQRLKGEPRRGRVTVWAARASRSSVILDLDGDGDLDIVTNDYGDVPAVLVSDLAQRGSVNFLPVRLVGTRSNRDGLGAVVTVTAGGRSQAQVNDGKSGYVAQSVMPLYFGLGASNQADSITVRWPSGTVQTVRGPLQSGRAVVVTEP